MANVFIRLSQSSSSTSQPMIQSPHRTSITSTEHTSLFMPSRISSTNDNPPGTTIKVVSVPLSPTDTRGLPASTLVLDEHTGSVKAILNARNLTAARTAAGSLLATTLLLPTRTPTHLTTFGSGPQASHHTKLHLLTYPTITHCTLITRTPSHLLPLLEHLRTTFPRVSFHQVPLDDKREVKKAVESAQVICTATSSEVPLFAGEWVKEGTHVNLVGSYKPSMHEVDGTLLGRASVILVDSRDACLKEAGELIDFGDGLEVVEVGEYLLAQKDTEEDGTRRKGNEKAGGITIFKSVGIGAQDTALALAVVRKAEERRDLGVLVPEYD